MSFSFVRYIKSTTENNCILIKKELHSAVRGRRLLRAGAAAFLIPALLLSGCRGGNAGGEDERFREYTREVFCQEISSDVVSLHYTLKEPERFGISGAPAVFGEFSADSTQIKAACENMATALTGFSYNDLSIQNRLTYDILEYYLEAAEESADYLLYEEPLGLVSGVQTQLPVILSEYQFYDREDVEEYLQLMQSTPDYIDSLIRFEREKSEAGLFMADYAADTVIEQCSAFLAMGDGNYLYSTFADRIAGLEELTEKEKSDYIEDNALMMEDYVYPAYQTLMAAVEELKGTGQNDKGLCCLPEGTEYYEMLVRQSTGTDQTVRELEDLTRRQIVEDLESMESIVGITRGEAQETAASMGKSDAELILSELQTGISAAFPEYPETELEVKYVPEAMEEHLSPAFYMIPAIDNTQENVIYINQSQMGDDLTLFTTLAHEGFPGHLYQTVFFEATDPDPVRSLFSFGGYVEGWATYAEMCSYYLTPLSKEQAALLQKNSSIILALYALADMGIHYEGWSRMDTVAFFSNYGITDADTVERIYELIIGSPANYLKYYIGYVQFLELKKDWAREKKEDFSQKEFHEAVLTVGPAPFELVEKYMWDIAENDSETDREEE